MYPLKWQTKPDESILITLRMEGWWWSIRSIDSYAIRILPLPVASILFPLLNSQQSQPRDHRLKFQNAFRTKPSIALLRNMLQGLFRHSMMWLPCLRAYGSRILTSNGFLLPLSFIAAILSSQCQMLSLFRSNFVPQISFREASPFFLSEKQSKSKLFNHLFLFYFLSISTFWKPIPSKGLKFLENKEVHHLH